MKSVNSGNNRRDRFVCIITETRSFGGVEAHTLMLIESLIKYGYKIELIINRFEEYKEWIFSYRLQDGVTIINTNLGGIFDEQNDIKKWKKILRSICSSILIFPKGHNLHGHISFLYACRRKFKRIIFIEHLEAKPIQKKTSRLWFGSIPGIGLWWHKRRFLIKARSFFADCIIAVSKKVKDSLIENCGYSSKKVVVINNGIPWRDFSRSEFQRAAFYHQFGIPQEAFVFGMLTRLSVVKGIDIALRALHKLVEDNLKKPFYLVIAGDGSEMDSLKHLAEILNLSNYVKFIGFVNDPKLILSGYDVILFSSRLEGLPLALLEGMASGCIPIVTRVSGMPEVVNSRNIGLVVSPENADELYLAMKHIVMLEESHISQMRQCAMRRVQENFDIDKSHRAILSILENSQKPL